MKASKDIFISYGRGNENSPGSKNFVINLAEKLEHEGYSVWLDKNDIPIAVDYQQEINDGIEGADNFLFIISPHSTKSIYCLKEIEEAITHHKRIIPILHIKPEDSIISESMHPEIGKLNWHPFENEEDFDDSFKSLVEVIETDRGYIKEHTKLTTKASEWVEKKRNSDLLLVGNELKASEKWLEDSQRKQKSPDCSDLQIEYIRISRKKSNSRRNRNLIFGFFITAITILLALTIYFNYQENQALDRENYALDKEKKALEKALQKERRANSNKLIAAINNCGEVTETTLKIAALAFKSDTSNINARATFYQKFYEYFSPDKTYDGTVTFRNQALSVGNNKIIFHKSGNTIEMHTEDGEVLGSWSANGFISSFDVDDSGQTLKIEVDGKTQEYNLDEAFLLEKMRENVLNSSSFTKEEAQRFGIKPEMMSNTDFSIIGEPKPTQNQSSEENTDEAQNDTTQNENSTTTSQNDPSSSTVETDVEEDELASILDSEDRKTLIDAYNKYYKQYQNATDNTERLSQINKVVQIGERAAQLFEKDRRLKQELSKGYGFQSWEKLKNKEFDAAITAGQKGLSTDENQLWMLKYIALSHVFKDEYDKAKEILDLIDSKPYPTNFPGNHQTFNESILEDIETLQSLGFTQNRLQEVISQMEEITMDVQEINVLTDNFGGTNNDNTISIETKGIGIVEYKISLDPYLRDTQWQPYRGSIIKYTFTRGQKGNKTIYIQYRDAKGKTSPIANRRVTLR